MDHTGTTRLSHCHSLLISSQNYLNYPYIEDLDVLSSCPEHPRGDLGQATAMNHFKLDHAGPHRICATATQNVEDGNEETLE